jgi:hypothetical protein
MLPTPSGSTRKRPLTREERIRQVIDELESGDVYMTMTWKAGDNEKYRGLGV